MANNRVCIECDICKETLPLGTYMGAWEMYSVDLNERINGFIAKHEHYMDQPDEYRYGYCEGPTNFSLKFESSFRENKEY